MGCSGQLKEPKPITWTPNAGYHIELITGLQVPVLSAETRANLDMEDGFDVIPVSLVMVDGRAQFREENVMLRRDSGNHPIIDA
jgi:hypothetical protein